MKSGNDAFQEARALLVADWIKVSSARVGERFNESIGRR